MAIKRYTANADTTITDAFKADLTTRGTGSNMGLSDSLEVFSIYGQTISGSGAVKTAEASRILVNFPISQISTDRTNDDIPASGSVNFYLKMFNAKHPFTVPVNFTLSASAVKKDWEEGYGLDMEGYRDETKDSIGANWINSAANTAWDRVGGDYDTTFSSSFEQTFEKGTEDLEMNITTLVEQWLSSSVNDPDGTSVGDKSSARYGLGIHLTSSQEASSSANLTGSAKSYYTKKFFARGSEYFFKRPILEARWDSSKKDNRGAFYYSSSLAPAADNLNTLYLYNYVRGQLKDIPDLTSGIIYLSLYSGSSSNTKPYGPKLNLSVGGDVVAAADLNVTGGYISTGIYTASFAFTGSTALTKVFDVWHDDAGTLAHNTNRFFTGTISPNILTASNYNPNDKYITSMPNIKPAYSRNETARYRIYTRKKDWNPTIYTKAVAAPVTEIIEDAYYKVIRVKDDLTVIDYGTGSLNHTRLSYDVNGNHFDLDMSMLQADYMYGMKFIYYLNGKYIEQPEIFKFRVEKDLNDVE